LNHRFFNPTEFFPDVQANIPLFADGFLADRDALKADWGDVGADMTEAINEYRKYIGACPQEKNQ